MSGDRPRLWIEEASPAFGWALVVCEHCDRRWFPVMEPRAFAERHAWEHTNAAGLPVRVWDEAELVCAEPGCRRRAVYADALCRACHVRVRRAAA
ncbi:hypothetical protein GCM10009840_17950 [Pseudolysinimonas kribbensis]|uniref:C2H2-type domain-containing protein n=1 Tax=Pseudolysinimonas kribbensis TaxID=433641 RepID=A0ABQ6JZP6_9MICO|nr:hypothetical protein GCM10025881_06470 [Pseudolysinimonas kribbensis]